MVVAYRGRQHVTGGLAFSDPLEDSHLDQGRDACRRRIARLSDQPVGLAGGELRRQVGVLPQLRLYDREGKLAKVVLGMVEMDGLKHLLERLL